MQWSFPWCLQNCKTKTYLQKRKKDPSNYRPISLLPIISKVIERIVHDQANSQTIIFCIISNLDSDQITQQVCLAHLTNKILKGFDEGLLTGMIFIDLQKAFDTINHEVLLQKHKAIRFLEQSIQWFRCYLCDRTFLAET